MTIEEIVKRALLEEQADVLCAAVEAVCAALMEAERRPDDRMTHRNGYPAREWQTLAGTVELQIPKLRRGQLFPELCRAAPAL